MEEKWLLWATQLQSIAQAGLAFSADRYDLDRYEQIRALSVEIMQEYTGISYQKVRELFASESGYQTPKIDIRSAVFRENEILMVREKIDGAWSLPGGWADINSSVSESAVRECSEEAGADVKPKRIIAIHHANRRNNRLLPYTTYKIFVECDLINFSFKENTETSDADFFNINNLPVLSTNRNTQEQIEMCFNAKSQKTFMTIFD
jgi:ADP-ribose pyrophosphatase YjhB (NUDIX family)